MITRSLPVLLGAMLLSPQALAKTPRSAIPAPRLIVAISVDQLSADLFNQYRSRFIGGFSRLQQGIVFPSTYHGQATTETCPGHATILTGTYPARSGIIANSWIDPAARRSNKTIYCAEDESAPNTDSGRYVVSPVHLKVPTLGDRMKTADPRSRVFAVAGKDRAAVMMAGHKADQVWWWDSTGFTSFKGRSATPPVAVVNGRVAEKVGQKNALIDLPELCSPPASRAAGTKTTKNSDDFLTRPDLDLATLDLAAELISSDRLGQGPAPDLVAIGLSATDYIGHTYGTAGPEMCAQMVALDAALARFFAKLDTSDLPYAVMLTADHGSHTILTDEGTASPLTLAALNKAIGHGADPAILGQGIGGDLYVARKMQGGARDRVITDAKRWLQRQDRVQAVFTSDMLAKTAQSPLPPNEWALIERTAAGFNRDRSGDLFVVLKPSILQEANATRNSIASHGSAWDYDRRVPLLFWWSGISGFEQPQPIEAVDIMPMLAALIRLPLDSRKIDGQCRDLDAGSETTCP